MKQKEFNKVILPMSSKIYSYATRITGNQDIAKDVVQDIMLKLWEKRKDLGQYNNLTGFVIRMTRNHCIDLLRRKKDTVSDDEYRKELQHEPFSLNNIENKELYKIISDIINTFPESHREVVILKDLEGYSGKEISEITGLGMNNIRVIISRCRRKIKDTLINDYQIKNVYD